MFELVPWKIKWKKMLSHRGGKRKVLQKYEGKQVHFGK